MFCVGGVGLPHHFAEMQRMPPRVGRDWGAVLPGAVLDAVGQWGHHGLVVPAQGVDGVGVVQVGGLGFGKGRGVQALGLGLDQA